MVCTPGGEARALPPSPLQLAARFSVPFFFLSPVSFSSSFFSPSLFLFLFFHSPNRERGRPREITRPPWAPARPSRAQRSLLSQFANRAPGPRIVHLHFTIFRSEINTAPSAPHYNVPSCTILLSLSLSPVSRLRGSSRFVPAGFWAGSRGTAHRPRKRTTVAVLAKYREAWKLMQACLSVDRSWRWLIIKRVQSNFFLHWTIMKYFHKITIRPPLKIILILSIQTRKEFILQ